MEYRTTLSHGLTVAGALLGGKRLAVAWTMAHVPVWPTTYGTCARSRNFCGIRQGGTPAVLTRLVPIIAHNFARYGIHLKVKVIVATATEKRGAPKDFTGDTIN